MVSFTGAGTALALAAAAALVATTADARSRRHGRHVVPVEVPVVEVAPSPPATPNPLDLAVGALTTNLAASSYNNAFYGYGSYYAPSAGLGPGQVGYGYFGY